MQSTLNIMVTGAGAPGIKGTLYALHQNPDNAKVLTVGIDLNRSAVGRHFVDQFEVTPSPKDENYIPYIKQLCKKHKINVILPQTTNEIFTLSKHKNEFEALGIPIIVSPHDTINIANNKWKLIKTFNALNLPAPKCYLVSSPEQFIKAARDLGYPEKTICTKPPVSNGMRGFRIIRDTPWTVERFFSEKPAGEEITLDNLLKILNQAEDWPEMIVSEHLPGNEYSVDCFIGTKCSVAIPRLRKVIRSGISFETEIELQPEMEKMSVDVAKHIGLQYCCGFQYKLDEQGIPKILECNPRVQGTMVTAVFGGANIIWASIQEALKNPPEKLAVTNNKATFSRFWGGIGISSDSAAFI